MLLGSVVAAASLVSAGVGCSHADADAGSSSSEVTGATPVLPVISQVFGGDATGTGAYVEVFNPSAENIAAKAFVLQWASGDADFPAANVIPLPSQDLKDGQLVPGQHLHVKLPDGQVLPTAGKIALAYAGAHAQGCVENPPSGSSCAKQDTVDYFGWGPSTFVPQPGKPGGSLTPDNAAVRANGGCQNAGDSAKDFLLGSLTQHTLEDEVTPCVAPGTDAGAKINFFLLNEIKLRQGAAGNEGFVEIACAKDGSLANTTFVAVDDTGVAVRVVDLGGYACGTGPASKTSGIVLLAEEGGVKPESSDATVIRLAPAPNASTASSFFLIYAVPGTVVVGKSYDLPVDGGAATQPDGTPKLTWPIDAPSWDSIAVAPNASAKRYAKPLVNATIDALSRPFYGPGTAPLPNSPVQWFGGALASGDGALFYDASKTTKNIPQDVFALTPGASNLPPDTRVDGGTDTGADIGTEGPDAGLQTTTDPAATPKKNNPAPEALADSAPSVCSMTSGPRGPGYGFLAVFGAALGLAAARRKKR